MLASIHKKKKKIVYTGVIVALLIVVGFFISYKLSSNLDQPIVAGQRIVVTVTADLLEDVYGYQFEINYDNEELEYFGNLTSKIDDIQTIFYKAADGYQTIGATMIGEQNGVSGENRQVCEMEFTVKKDGMLSDFNISLTDVNVVKSDLEYIEDIEGWLYKTTIQS